MRSENRALLRERCRTVWLDVEPAEAARRVRGTGTIRPLLGAGPAEPRLDRLRRQRHRAYAEVSFARIDTTGRDPTAAAELVLERPQSPTP